VATYQYQNGYGDTFAFSVTAGIDPATGNLAIAINPEVNIAFCDVFADDTDPVGALNLQATLEKAYVTELSQFTGQAISQADAQAWAAQNMNTGVLATACQYGGSPQTNVVNLAQTVAPVTPLNDVPIDVDLMPLTNDFNFGLAPSTDVSLSSDPNNGSPKAVELAVAENPPSDDTRCATMHAAL
jgi:hypothetical protein